tara:strand:- start:1145 stop:2026 length:882 start_codon:yes stop_codon:yes gene_type:complete
MQQYDEIILGSSLSALLHAFRDNLPVFFTAPRIPFRFDYLNPDTNTALLKLHGQPLKSLTTPNGENQIGTPKHLLWERLMFILCLDGKVPLSNLCHNIRYDGERVVCSNEYSKIMEFEFQKCYYYGDEKSLGFVKEKPLALEEFLCYDYIAFNKGGKHLTDYIKTEDEWVSEIWFYPSDRIDGNTLVKDACALSHLTHEKLNNFDYSETMTRFKLIAEMENRGMKGLFNGYTKNGNPKHYKFRTSHIRRVIEKKYSPQISKAPEIICKAPNEEILLSSLPSAVVAYDRFLKHL